MQENNLAATGRYHLLPLQHLRNRGTSHTTNSFAPAGPSRRAQPALGNPFPADATTASCTAEFALAGRGRESDPRSNRMCTPTAAAPQPLVRRGAHSAASI